MIRIPSLCKKSTKCTGIYIDSFQYIQYFEIFKCIHFRQHAQLSEAVVPVLPAPVFQHPATILATTNAPASMALMPYNGLNSSQSTKIPLTPDELSKLYNMGPMHHHPPQYLSGGTIIAQSQYMQQTTQQTTMYSHPYSQTIERPFNAPIPYTFQQQPHSSAATINTLTMQQHSKTVNFPNSNSSTNIENNLALVSLYGWKSKIQLQQ